MQISDGDTIISVKDAVQAALAHIRNFSDIFPNAMTPRLEETVYDERAGEWIITLSFPVNMLLGEGRTYKLFHVNARTGAVISMTNRA